MRRPRGKIDKLQIIQIHALVAKLKIDHDLYMDMLAERFPGSVTDPENKIATSTRLSYAEAARFIVELRKMLTETGYKKYDEYGIRPNMAKPAALRKIAALWNSVTRQVTQKDKDKALNEWLHHHFHISHIKFIEDYQVGKIVFTLKAMQAQKKTEVV